MPRSCSFFYKVIGLSRNSKADLFNHVIFINVAFKNFSSNVANPHFTPLQKFAMRNARTFIGIEDNVLSMSPSFLSTLKIQVLYDANSLTKGLSLFPRAKKPMFTCCNVEEVCCFACCINVVLANNPLKTLFLSSSAQLAHKEETDMMPPLP